MALVGPGVPRNVRPGIERALGLPVGVIWWGSWLGSGSWVVTWMMVVRCLRDACCCYQGLLGYGCALGVARATPSAHPWAGLVGVAPVSRGSAGSGIWVRRMGLEAVS